VLDAAKSGIDWARDALKGAGQPDTTNAAPPAAGETVPSQGLIEGIPAAEWVKKNKDRQAAALPGRQAEFDATQAGNLALDSNARKSVLRQGFNTPVLAPAAPMAQTPWNNLPLDPRKMPQAGDYRKWSRSRRSLLGV
jgi:hypothetical protein